MSRKGFMIALAVIAALMAALLVWVFSAAEAEKNWDVCYEMTNVNVNWEQTYFPGSWNGV